MPNVFVNDLCNFPLMIMFVLFVFQQNCWLRCHDKSNRRRGCFSNLEKFRELVGDDKKDFPLALLLGFCCCR